MREAECRCGQLKARCEGEPTGVLGPDVEHSA
jgi:hypothetical protein